MNMNPAGAKKSQKIVLELAGVNYTRPAFSDLLEGSLAAGLVGSRRQICGCIELPNCAAIMRLPLQRPLNQKAMQPM